jgi:ribulose-5-phosphate 4-epimerase/fuculose-1-phosphate aldolase
MLPDLSPREGLAVLARSLHREGYDDHTVGHIAFRQPDGSFLVNPWELAWSEVRASDVVRIDASGAKLEGAWSPNPAIILHLRLHELRPDAVFSIHHHSRFGTIWSALHRIPPAYDQFSACAVEDEIVFVDEYAGGADDPDIALRTAKAISGGNFALLANHGVMVVARDIRQAHFRAAALEWRCKQAWHVEAVGGGVPMAKEGERAFIKAVIDDLPDFPNFWEAAIRQEIRLDPGVLE